MWVTVHININSALNLLSSHIEWFRSLEIDVDMIILFVLADYLTHDRN